MKRNWKVEYYLYDLTERVEKRFFTKFAAILYAWYIMQYTGVKTYIKH